MGKSKPDCPAPAKKPAAVADMTDSMTKETYALFDRHHDRIRRFILMTVRDSWVADDLTQETFIRAHRRMDRLRNPDRVSSWLFKIAYRLCLDHFRLSARVSRKETPMIGEMIRSCMPATDKKLEREEMNACIQRQILRLPESRQTVILLYDIFGFSQKEIAGILDITVENVKVRLHRARKEMKSILQSNCHLEKDERDVLVCEPKRPGV